MKAKALIKLLIVAILIAAVSFLALNGLQIDKYILKPVASAISLGLDLRGGISTEYIVTDTDVENYDVLLDGTVSALRTRLINAGFTEATVAIQGTDRILVEIPDVDDPEEVAAIIGTPPTWNSAIPTAMWFSRARISFPPAHSGPMRPIPWPAWALNSMMKPPRPLNRPPWNSSARASKSGWMMK